ncbi:MAG: aminomethyl-transferring glycine dehydrogenase subunit GcvPA [bacterium]|nr:aminomethyl-transferring glycine dehydrogenase subunit GcvPA [bacterium]
MTEPQTKVHPYMPNTLPETKRKMLEFLEVDSVEDLYSHIIPSSLRFSGRLDLPEAIESESDLKRHVELLMSKNTSTAEVISFLGAGCYQHYVPAVCDEINSRSEFLTAYCGETYSDHGKMQAIFEYCSMMAELVDLDVVSYTLYDGGQAACSSMRMALRATERREIILPKSMNPEILSQAKDYLQHVADLKYVGYDSLSGQIDLDELRGLISLNTAAVYLEMPSFLGAVEQQIAEISALAHSFGALLVVSVDPSSLGIFESPANLGADIVCGDIQSLGMHMHYGGGCAGFIATRQERKMVSQYPTYLYGITTTKTPGEYGWGRALNERTSHGSREHAHEYFGTEAGLWAITAGVYLALMGPNGMKELGETIIYRTLYARKTLNTIAGVKLRFPNSLSFKEFVLDFSDSQKSVGEINSELLNRGIFGGKDLSADFQELNNCALYCITEMISADDIDRLKGALQEIVAS